MPQTKRTYAMKSYNSKLVETKKEAQKHNKSCLKGTYKMVYKFNENVLQGESDLKLEKNLQIQLQK